MSIQSIQGASAPLRPRRFAPKTGGDSKFRPEIQALRALAVTAVLLYHLWPKTFSGGYIGVDVFLVISGYLISAHIQREIQSTGTFRFRRFYMRRVRRLLPAALLVLAVVAVVTILLIPMTYWKDWLGQVVSSLFYVENWYLALSSTDYLAASANASPVQHFWSLSLEEQFYLLWPIWLVFGLWALSKTGLSRRNQPIWTIGIALIASLGYSIWFTNVSAAEAYFVTPTRIWEFAAGGIAAAIGLRIRNRFVAGLASWCGLAVIAACVITLSGATPFPGWIALIPVASTLLVIAAGVPAQWWSTQWLIRFRITQWLGAISYSLYLWHWPLIVIIPVIAGSPLTGPQRLGLIALSAAAGWASKRYVEDRFRQTPNFAAGAKPVRRALVGLRVALIGSIAVAAVALPGLAATTQRSSEAEIALADAQASDFLCLGWNAAQPGCAPAANTSSVIPDPIIAQRDVATVDCAQRGARTKLLTCEFGSKGDNAVSVVLAGDSHAGQWLPALENIALARNWKITTLLKTGCRLTQAPAGTLAVDANCALWNQSAQDWIMSHTPDLVFVSGRSSSADGIPTAEVDLRAQANGIANAWRSVTANGSSLIALAETPQPVVGGLTDPGACVLAHDQSQCTFREGLETSDPQPLAAEMVPGVSLIDLSDEFCIDGYCPAVVGSILVYADNNHTTASFMQTLTVPLGRALTDF
ncbi:acyltransferase family protein [Cryobacterium arcticum]|nr:acyltransferase family protein [Cryobacterium arcticum]